MKKVKKEALKASVDAVAPKLGENVVFIAGGREITGGQHEIEFVQHRALAGRKTSLFAALNEGDKRFNSGKSTMRVWLMVNAIGFVARFPELAKKFNFAEFAEMAKGTYQTDDRVAILEQVQTVNVDNVNHPIKIVCKETTDLNAPGWGSIKKQFDDPNTTEEIKDRYVLQTGKRNGKESERIVDELGNTIYRQYQLSYGDDTDVLVPNKVLQSELAARVAGVDKTEELLKSQLAE